MRYVYPCVLTPEEGGGFCVSFPDVPGANTCGDDRAEALAMAEEALAGHVHEQWDVPAPSPAGAGQVLVAVSPLVAAKLALYTAMREQGMTRAALADRLRLSESIVGRILDPDHRTPISQIERALRVVGRRLAVEDQVA